jgi:hypothetical protein
MNDKRENRLSRNLKVITFMDDHEATLVAGAPGLTAFATQYRNKTAECVEHAQEANEDITGASEQKTYLRNVMRDLAVAISGALYAHFLSVNNVKDARKSYLTKSEVDLARDTDAYVECKRILEIAQANSAPIIPLGATAAKVTALSDAIDAYYDMIQDPQDERIERTAALNMFDKAMRESDDVLTIIAGIMLTQKEEFPALHMQFVGATAIDDNLGGGTPLEPDFEFMVQPGTFYTAVGIPYSEMRRFNAVNLSPEPVHWGLSTAEGSFTNPLVILNPNATSTLLSTTLGGSGDFLIFENTHPINLVQIELTVLDE